MSNKGRSNAAKRRRHAKAMAKRKAEKDQRKLAYRAKIEIGTNSKRKKINARKGRGKLVADTKNPPPYGQGYVYVPPSRYSSLFE